MEAQIVCEYAVQVGRQIGRSTLIAKALINYGVILRSGQQHGGADITFREANKLALDNNLADVLAVLRRLAEEADL